MTKGTFQEERKSKIRSNISQHILLWGIKTLSFCSARPVVQSEERLAIFRSIYHRKLSPKLSHATFLSTKSIYYEGKKNTSLALVYISSVEGFVKKSKKLSNSPNQLALNPVFSCSTSTKIKYEINFSN